MTISIQTQRGSLAENGRQLQRPEGKARAWFPLVQFHSNNTDHVCILKKQNKNQQQQVCLGGGGSSHMIYRATKAQRNERR